MNTIGNTVRLVSVTLEVLCWISNLQASPVGDLNSPSQQTRDAAANALRQTYAPPPSTNWSALVRALKLGSAQTAIEAQLRSSNLVSGGGTGSGSTEVSLYRLDDLWMLACSFTNSTSSLSNSGLAAVTIREQLRNVWVQPPTNFTGVWRTYWANGQPSHEFHYQNGRPEGMLTTFHPDGSKSTVSPLHNGVPDGEETGFYPSGKVRYRGTASAGSPVGTWVWYKEDGSVESKQDHTKK
jgi:hypothetical protein